MKFFQGLTAVFLSIFFISNISFAQWALDTVIQVGNNPAGIAVTADGSKLVVTDNTDPGSVKIISTSDYSISNIDISNIENYPNAVAVSPNDSIALVNTMHKTIFINVYSRSVVATFTAPCASTTLYGIAVTPDGNSAVYPDLSSGCTQQGLRIIDANGKSSNSKFIGVNTSGVLTGIGITPDGSSALVTTFSLDAPKIVNLINSSVQNIAGISSGSYGISMFHKSDEALIFDGDSLDRVSLISNSVTKKISGLSYNTNLQNIAITGDDKYAFVVGAFEKLVVSLENDSVLETFTAGGTNVAANSDGSYFFVTDGYNGTVRVYKKQTLTGIKTKKNIIVSDYRLYQNYPNPFNPSTIINYQLPKDGPVTLKIFNELGQEVKTLVNQYQSRGTYTVNFEASGLTSGIYFYKLQAGYFSSTKKMLLIK